jgi:biotin carboxyl carrier protein
MNGEIPAILTVGDGADVSLLAPSVARISLTVQRGDVIQSCRCVGQIEVMGRRRRLVAPPNAPLMRVRAVSIDGGWQPVGYGQPLLSLVASAVETQELHIGGNGVSELGLPTRARKFAAPVEGLFYTCPRPGEPPFVSVGDVIVAGQPIGLVEVMKFFYLVNFELPGFSSGARVVHISVENESAINAGDPLIFVVPA